ncbi:lachesin-like [Homarus americanus]|uniref:lachesin-like n=1 Tax=Homarus americanus TaxID=6706 RepID=UPI001C4677EC|nr:lachesin-like [Homarus americanus]
MAPVTNYTAAVGKTADLTCRVQNLTKYKVAWFHMDRKMLLAIHKTVVTRMSRFSVVQDDQMTWSLHIDDVTREDKGKYMCQVNTEPMISQVGYLDVVVPPVIVDELSSGSSVVVQENGNVTLTCHAEGNPEPKISWVREDQRHITLSKRRKVSKLEESTLGLSKIRSSVSKRIELKVQFSPIVLLPNQLMSAPLGSSVWLECKTEAYPRAVTFWKHNYTMVMSTNKYKLEEFHHDDYTTTVKLNIKQLELGDFGKYLCYSRNSFGENDGTVDLHELKRDHPNDNKVKNIQDVEKINTIEQYPLERQGGRGQNHVIFDMEDNGIIPASNNINNDVTKGGVEQKSQLGRERGKNDIFSSILSGNAGLRASPVCPTMVLLIALSALHAHVTR